MLVVGSATLAVEPTDKLAVDLACGVEVLDVPGELLACFEQRLFQFGQPCAGGVRVDLRVVEVGERVVAEELAESAA